MQMMTRLLLCGLGAVGASCATTTHYARRPEIERSSILAADALRPGMTVDEVVAVMINARLPGQYVSLSSSSTCPAASTKIILHAGERLGKIGHTTAYAAGFVSIETYRRANASLASHGFERQGPLLEAVRAHGQEVLGCPQAVLSFDSTVEGGCGEDTIAVTLDPGGRLESVGPVRGGHCREADSNDCSDAAKSRVGKGDVKPNGHGRHE
jgi:hypothetical protein